MNAAIPRAAFNSVLDAQNPRRVGTLGRNTFRRDGIENVDFSLVKRFPLRRENTALQFRAEFFNLFNHPQWDIPVNNLAAGATFGQIRAQANSPRLVRLGLKFEF